MLSPLPTSPNLQWFLAVNRQKKIPTPRFSALSREFVRFHGSTITFKSQWRHENTADAHYVLVSCVLSVCATQCRCTNLRKTHFEPLRKGFLGVSTADVAPARAQLVTKL